MNVAGNTRTREKGSRRVATRPIGGRHTAGGGMERGWIRTSIVRGGPGTVGEEEREGGLLGAQDANLVAGGEREDRGEGECARRVVNVGENTENN